MAGPSDTAVHRTARDVVAERTGRRAGKFPDLPLGRLDTTGLSTRDAALAAAIDHLIATRWLTLEAVVSSRLDRDWSRVEPRLQGVLLAGAAQILFFDRLPDHAVIDEMVETAKRLVRPKAAGFVNAVLRRVAALRGDVVATFDPDRRDEVPLADGRALRLRETVFAADHTAWLSATTSHGLPLLERWHDGHGRDAKVALAHHDLFDAPIIVAGNVDGDVPNLVPHTAAGHHVFTGDRAELAALLSAHPTLWVQDPTSARPVLSTQGLTPKVILDYCAGKGTKTRQLRHLHPDATIVATERDASRYRHLEALADELSVEVVAFDRLEPWRERVDLLVLDVPCSNTGVLARRPEAKYRFDEQTLKSLVDQQRQIVADTLPLLTPGGFLLYATCSIEAAENSEQVAWLQRWHRFDVVDSVLTLPHGQPGDPATQYVDGGGHTLLARGDGR